MKDRLFDVTIQEFERYGGNMQEGFVYNFINKQVLKPMYLSGVLQGFKWLPISDEQAKLIAQRRKKQITKKVVLSIYKNAGKKANPIPYQ